MVYARRMNAPRLLALVASAGFLLAACDKNESAPSTATASPSTKATTIPPSASSSSPTPAPSPSPSAPIVCNIHPCHGLAVECTTAPPEACTEIYMMGDFCRGFVECTIVDGKCAVAPSAKFTECKECLAKCAAAKKKDCDESCRKTMNVH